MTARLLSIVTLALAVAGCGFVSPLGDQIIAVSQLDNSNTTLDTAISIQLPTTELSVESGTKTTLAWSDIAKLSGTTVRLQAQRVASVGNPVSGYGFTGPVIHLIGDGTPGSGNDAVSDGVNDTFVWEVTGVRIGKYLITATIDAPDGTSKSAVSADSNHNTDGLIVVTTTLAAPTLTFTNPGATDVTATSPNPETLTWTDNGNTNANAQITLLLDPDSNHTSGNEIILAHIPLSDDANAGSFDFNFVDESGNPVPGGTYTVAAQLDDNLHDITIVEATGKLIVQ